MKDYIKNKGFTVKKKLILLILLVVMVTSALMLITVISMSKLGAFQDDQYLKSQVAVTAVEASKIGDELYSIIADSIINHNMEETDKEWSKMKIDKEKLIQEVIENSDTDEEKALASTANDAFHKYVDIYENKLISLLRQERVYKIQLKNQR
ncbi:hypothetical protein GKZ28_16630 [Clostridium chromiireducens]|uniref:Uncharacterized protein n=1 Tax=Clostridium chromiireducens TaxID=225345 RepID=A0A964W3G1_9CLOT|nr:hypothetical protein [Clostridium chromiireducens]MVX65320.1 hypothetical protein [Clostridium chromiireducens]